MDRRIVSRHTQSAQLSRKEVLALRTAALIAACIAPCHASRVSLVTGYAASKGCFQKRYGIPPVSILTTMRKLNRDFSAAQRCSYIFFTGKTDDLVPYLNALQFRNGPSFVYANQSFGLQQFCVLYTEPENVSTIRFGWDTLGLRSYLFQNPGDPKMQRSPPMGMRSAVPLGGLGKSDLEVISYET